MDARWKLVARCNSRHLHARDDKSRYISRMYSREGGEDVGSVWILGRREKYTYSELAWN
jgi:hypothetical protein